MRLNKFITNNCCNYLGTACIGVWNTKRFNDTNTCSILKREEKPEPCYFFEKMVLPLATKLTYYDELVDEYSQIDFGVIKRTKEVRDKKSKKVKNTKKRR